ncbi:NUDIX hydrolase [Saccharicrinis fermentans]|uniref:Bifunctional NMN adenylyltransferase/Nudix hydrolase n=1 Tax=Saccharicrinis fermentans DSM 9555 = JCM 21142 TaxID=869213 RepID=W7YI96_9BACT|nr:NUDIX domain-containing protein [Saccharicrinis fermentans]GAF02284.1 bifunctional NMN adenylyltransferase/Nudix hydrolase [Saccharicrinis fermentans DSM 9555 = JCM 21142]
MNTQNKTYSYEYPRPSVTTDCVIFGFDGIELNILLIERGIEPFKGQWALPGGFLQMDETTEECARRELTEETGVSDLYLEQLYTFSDVKRDPRGRVITVSYYALIRSTDFKVIGGDDASAAKWFPIHQVPSLAFDHDRILREGHNRLKSKIRYEPIGFELLEEIFTIPQLQRLYEAILGIQLDRRNFNRKITSLDILEPIENKLKGVGHKGARQFRFDKEKYQALKSRGLNFEI